MYSYKNMFECDAGHSVREGTSIEVYGLDPLTTTNETIEMFFENERRSGGGEVDKVHFDHDTNVAYVTFHSRDGECLVYVYTCRRA